MAKTYATVADVEAVVGHPLNAGDAARVTTMLEAATAAFDRETGQSFIDGAPISAEFRAPTGPDVWLRRYPVASVEAVRGRSGAIGAPQAALVALTGYELLDPDAGRLRVGWCGASAWSFVSVDYTPVAVPVPPDVVECVARLAAFGLSSAGAGAVESLTVGDVSIRYAAPAASSSEGAGGVPVTVAAVVERYRRAVFA